MHGAGLASAVGACRGMKMTIAPTMTASRFPTLTARRTPLVSALQRLDKFNDITLIHLFGALREVELCADDFRATARFDSLRYARI